jgi:hypothetical protein
MCDYSLSNVVSRPARVGDKLVTTSFANTDTRGFAAVDEPEVAVCLLPGTEIAFDADARRESMFSWLLPNLRSDQIGARVARFRHVNPEAPTRHHDALEFPNGRVVLLTRMRKRQYATVLQLPASERVPETTEPEIETALA